MMPTPPDAPLTVRLAARLGPELVAAVLVAAVVLVAVGVAVSGRRLGPPPGASVAPSVAAVPSGSAGTSTASPPSSPSIPARALLEIVDRLITQRAALAQQAAADETDATAIADLLREVNQSMVLQDGPLAALADEPGTDDLVTRIRTMNDATFEAVRRAQRASITNEAAYQTGAEETVAALAALTAIRGELAALAGETPAP